MCRSLVGCYLCLWFGAYLLGLWCCLVTDLERVWLVCVIVRFVFWCIVWFGLRCGCDCCRLGFDVLFWCELVFGCRIVLMSLIVLIWLAFGGDV